MALRSLENRKLDLARLPWVTPLKAPQPCEGIKYGTVATRDLFPWGPGRSNPARGIQDKSRCKNLAHWRFKGLKRDGGRSGTYCWAHLMSMGIYGSMNEDERSRRWYAKNGWVD